MKNLILAVTTVTLLAASCTNTETLNGLTGNEVAFGTSLNKNGKAAITGTTYPTNVPFGVFGYVLTNNATWDASASTTNPIMNNVPISYQTNMWKATGAPFYWPTDPGTSITFVAYSPIANEGGTNTPASFTTTEGMTFTNYVTDGATDLLYSEPAKDRKSGSPVPILFKHALAQVYFTFKTDKTYADITFTVNEIEVANVLTTATFTSLPTPSWTTPTTVGSWKPLTSGSFTFTATESAKAGSELLLLPQDATAITATVKYHVTGTGVVTEDITKSFTLTGTWGINQRIKYTMVVSLNEITFEPTVTDWDAPTDLPL